MPSSARPRNSTPPGTAGFALTRWSVVLAARRGDSTEARDALELLCRTYWRPICLFIARRGHSPQDAQDLTQDFFARLLAKNCLDAVEPAKGRFRSFLLAALKHFLANEWDKTKARKRGGDRVLVPLVGQATDTSPAWEPVETETPEAIFDRTWALALLDLVLARLRDEYARDGRTDWFDHLKATLTGERSAIPYSALGAQLGQSEGALKVAVHRLRRRYRELVREEIAHTVSRPEQVEEELRALFAALGS